MQEPSLQYCVKIQLKATTQKTHTKQLTPGHVQVAKVMGAIVVAYCRGADKAAALRELGADHIIDSAADDRPLRQQVKARLPDLHGYTAFFCKTAPNAALIAQSVVSCSTAPAKHLQITVLCVSASQGAFVGQQRHGAEAAQPYGSRLTPAVTGAPPASITACQALTHPNPAGSSSRVSCHMLCDQLISSQLNNCACAGVCAQGH